MDIADLIREDLALIESSALVRETGDLLRLLLPVFKKIIAEEGAATPPPGWQVARESEIGTHEFAYAYPVPGYWKIPALRGKALAIKLFFYPMPGMPTARVAGSAVPSTSTLTLRVIIPDWNTNLLGKIQAGLKETLVHELTHFRDERPAKKYPSNKKAFAGDFAYFSHPHEVRAFTTEITKHARREKMSFFEMLELYAEQIWADNCTPAQIAKLRRLYTQEYNSRGYGNRPRARSR